MLLHHEVSLGMFRNCLVTVNQTFFISSLEVYGGQESETDQLGPKEFIEKWFRVMITGAKESSDMSSKEEIGTWVGI